MNTSDSRINDFNALLAYPAEKLQDVSLLGMRVYASWIFFPAGLLKVKNWGATMFLFEEEYQVPLLSPTAAACLGTLGELLFPVLLTLGLLGRFSAAGLFVVNLVAVLSLSVIQPAALGQHLLWGLLLFVVVLWGLAGCPLTTCFSGGRSDDCPLVCKRGPVHGAGVTAWAHHSFIAGERQCL